MDLFNLVICIACIISGVLTFIGGILWPAEQGKVTFTAVILCIYLMVIGAYIIVVEIFMPSKLQALMGFYVTWIGKAVLFIFIGVLFIIPFDEFDNANKDICIYFIITAVYNFVLAVFLIVLGILSLLSVVSRRSSHSIVGGSSSSSSSKKTTTTTTTVTVETR